MIVLKLIFTLATLLLWAADAAVLVYVVLTYVRISHPTANRIRQALALVCEPMLIPARRLLGRFLPAKYMILDWSPLVVWVVLGIARNVLGLLQKIIL